MKGRQIWQAGRTVREIDGECEERGGTGKRENNGKVDKADRTVMRFDSKMKRKKLSYR